MITTKGNELIGKSLTLGTSYASYIALGCGARPRKVFSVNIASTESSTLNAGSGNAKIITSTEHDFQVGDYVRIYNANGSNINSIYLGIWQISEIISTTSFKFLIGNTTERALASLSPSPKVILDFSNKKSLDFEMFRIPITTKTSFNENNIYKILLSADLPTSDRYEISEIGIFSLEKDSNSLVNNKTLFSFSSTENWKYHSGATIGSIPFKNVLIDTQSITNDIVVTDKAFQANANNTLFNNSVRILRQERPRFSINSYFLYGDTSNLTASGSGASLRLTPTTTTNHIEIYDTGVSVLKSASSADEIKFGLSIVNKTQAGGSPDKIRVLLEFANTDSTGDSTSSYKYKRFHAELISSSSGQDFSKNRYVVFTKSLNDIESSPDFGWDQVSFVKIYVSIIKNNLPSSDYIAAFDAITFNLTSTNNPLYGLSAYTIINSSDNATITKEENSQQSVEFKFGIGT
jgi:hypothetical protein